jgi:plasmid stabilization system protein ParE
LKDSRAKFGPTARARYALLIKTAYRDLLDDAERQGVSRSFQVSASQYLNHIRHARNRPPPGERVQNPRHIVAYKFDSDTLRVLRLLHDSMDIAAQLNEGDVD